MPPSLGFKSAEVVSGLKHLWKLLFSNQNLKYLNLGNTPMKDDDMKLACEALEHPKCALEALSYGVATIFSLKDWTAVASHLPAATFWSQPFSATRT